MLEIGESEVLVMTKARKEKKEKNQSIGALWFQKGKKMNYMSGQIEIEGELHKIVVFKNDYKKEDKQPDYRIYLKAEKPAEETEDPDDLPF